MRILIVRLGSLGDIMHTIPAQQYLRRRHPDAEIHWLTASRYRELLEAVPGITRVWAVDTQAWRRGLPLAGLQELRGLRRLGLLRAYDFQGLLKSAVLARLAGASEVVGFPWRLLREPLAGLFYHRRIPVTRERRHQIDRHQDLVEPPRHRNPGPVHPVPINLPSGAEASVDRLLGGRPAPVVLNPGGGWPTKRWAAERYGRLAVALRNELGLPVLLTYGPGEDCLAAEAVAASGDSLEAISTNLFELAALCRKARLLVAGDTGPLHLAEALGTPVVALLGPALPWRTGPFSPENPVVLHTKPCPHPYRRHCSRHFCMDIEVAPVLAAVKRVLGQPRKALPAAALIDSSR
jgi:lipopolysaccharide heptosyltransferase I